MFPLPSPNHPLPAENMKFHFFQVALAWKSDLNKHRKLTPKSLPGSTRSTQNRSREAPGAPKIDVKSLPGRSRAPKGPLELGGGSPRRLPEEVKGRFLTILGVQPGVQNRPKTGQGAKKCVRRRHRKRFLSVFLAVAVQSRSPDRF